MYALITTDRIHDGFRIAQVSSIEFEVTPRMRWVPCNSNINERQFYYGLDSTFKELPSSPPERVLVEVVSMRQARLALLQQGRLNQVKEAIAALEGPEGDYARIEWEYSTTVDIKSLLVASIITVLGLTPEEVQGLFNLAATL